jgi:ankyrin repeat protein
MRAKKNPRLRWASMTFDDIVDHCYERFRISDIEYWLDHGNEIDFQAPRSGPGYPRQGWTLLHYASSNGHRDVLKFLVAKGANMNMQDSAGWTALHLAVDLDLVVATQDGHMPEKLPTAEVLLKAGADPSIVNKDGETARDLLNKFGLGALFDRVSEQAAIGSK